MFFFLRYLLNTLTLRYLRKVQCICGEFLTDMPNDHPWRATGYMYPSCKKTQNDSWSRCFVIVPRGSFSRSWFFFSEFFSRPFWLFLLPTNCHWISEDAVLDEIVAVRGDGLGSFFARSSTRSQQIERLWRVVFRCICILLHILCNGTNWAFVCRISYPYVYVEVCLFLNRQT